MVFRVKFMFFMSLFVVIMGGEVICFVSDLKCEC